MLHLGMFLAIYVVKIFIVIKILDLQLIKESCSHLLSVYSDRLELQDEWRLENRRAFANIWSDMVFGISLFILLYLNQSQVSYQLLFFMLFFFIVYKRIFFSTKAETLSTMNLLVLLHCSYHIHHKQQ